MLTSGLGAERADPAAEDSGLRLEENGEMHIAVYYFCTEHLVSMFNIVTRECVFSAPFGSHFLSAREDV